jgi:hypothetical protein
MGLIMDIGTNVKELEMKIEIEDSLTVTINKLPHIECFELDAIRTISKGTLIVTYRKRNYDAPWN